MSFFRRHARPHSLMLMLMRVRVRLCVMCVCACLRLDKSNEEVAAEAVDMLASNLEHQACVDEHLQDQVGRSGAC